MKEVLFIDHAVFVRVSPAGPGQLKVDTFLYDLRTRRRLTRVTKTVQTAHAEKELSTLASALYLNVSYEAELVESKDAPPPKPYVRKPFYKTWWFWTAAGAAVTGVVLGATLARAQELRSTASGQRRLDPAASTAQCSSLWRERLGGDARSFSAGARRRHFRARTFDVSRLRPTS